MPATPGRFIAVEGIDAAGKSTVAAELVEHLTNAGADAVLLSRRTAPALAGGGYPEQHLRSLAALIWDYPPTARTSVLGFNHWSQLLASWFHAVDEVVLGPLLAAGCHIVADSWCGKYIARFAVTVGLADAQRPFVGLREADPVLWLDVSPQLCADRRETLRATERGEWQGLDRAVDGYLRYQTEIRGWYQALAETGRWQRIWQVDPKQRIAACKVFCS
jgi:thymidylate kinase